MTTPTEQQLGEAFEDLVSTQPFQPDVSSIVQRGVARRRRAVARRATTGLAVAGLAAGALVAVTGTTASTHHGPQGHVTIATEPTGPTVSTGPTGPAGGQTLTELAAYITANTAPQAGDATLVQRTQSHPGQSPVQGFDLYTDSGEYFYAESESGLPAAIRSNANQGDGMFAREIAAAEYAVSGNLAVADQRMAYAPFPDGKAPTVTPAQLAQQAQMVAQKLAAAGKSVPGLLQRIADGTGGTGTFNADNYIWMDSEDALQAGAGNPQVRAGILRILSTLPGITVDHTQIAGRPVLAITANGEPDLPASYHETITVDATTGVPVSLVGGTDGAAPSVTVTYHVSRVTVSDIEAGRF